MPRLIEQELGGAHGNDHRDRIHDRLRARDRLHGRHRAHDRRPAHSSRGRHPQARRAREDVVRDRRRPARCAPLRDDLLHAVRAERAGRTRRWSTSRRSSSPGSARRRRSRPARRSSSGSPRRTSTTASPSTPSGELLFQVQVMPGKTPGLRLHVQEARHVPRALPRVLRRRPRRDAERADGGRVSAVDGRPEPLSAGPSSSARARSRSAT